jgi:DNA-binding IclR family transcriptional regulator
MGAFSEIFGKVPRVLILEMFSEEPDEELTVKDIIDQTGISKRGAYLIIKKFVNEGLLVESGNRPKKYMLNHNDLRARTLINAESSLIMGKLEYELKVEK